MYNKKTNKNFKNSSEEYEKIDTRTEKRKIGDIGEEVACKFLVKRGYTIVERNYLQKFGEIDIISVKSSILHFIEVKTVTRNIEKRVIHETKDEYRAEDNVHFWKLQRLARTIQIYLVNKKLFDTDWCFDIIVVYLNFNKRKASLDFLENIIL